MSVFEAKTLGLCETLFWIPTVADKKVNIASTVNAMYRSEYFLEVEHIIEECRTMLQAKSNISVHFLRQVNRVVQLMTRMLYSLNCHNNLISTLFSLFKTIVNDSMV